MHEKPGKNVDKNVFDWLMAMSYALGFHENIYLDHFL